MPSCVVLVVVVGAVKAPYIVFRICCGCFSLFYVYSFGASYTTSSFSCAGLKSTSRHETNMGSRLLIVWLYCTKEQGVSTNCISLICNTCLIMQCTMQYSRKQCVYDPFALVDSFCCPWYFSSMVEFL